MSWKFCLQVRLSEIPLHGIGTPNKDHSSLQVPLLNPTQHDKNEI